MGEPTQDEGSWVVSSILRVITISDFTLASISYRQVFMAGNESGNFESHVNPKRVCVDSSFDCLLTDTTPSALGFSRVMTGVDLANRMLW